MSTYVTGDFYKFWDISNNPYRMAQYMNDVSQNDDYIVKTDLDIQSSYAVVTLSYEKKKLFQKSKSPETFNFKLRAVSDEFNQDMQKIDSYVKDKSPLYKKVTEEVYWTSRKWYDKPSQLVKQIAEFSGDELWQLSNFYHVDPIQDPLVAIEFYNAGPEEIANLVKQVADGKVKTNSIRLNQLEEYNSRNYNARVLGQFAFEFICEEFANQLFKGENSDVHS